MPRQLSGAGLTFIEEREGFQPKMYLDSAGLPTIGYGHLIQDTTGPLMTATLTRELARAMLGDDVARFEHCVNNAVKVELEQCEFDALVSFAFNVGCTNFRMSTLVRLINEGDKANAAEQFKRWVFAGGKKIAGLADRRAMEKSMFLGERWM